MVKLEAYAAVECVWACLWAFIGPVGDLICLWADRLKSQRGGSTWRQAKWSRRFQSTAGRRGGRDGSSEAEMDAGGGGSALGWGAQARRRQVEVDSAGSRVRPPPLLPLQRRSEGLIAATLIGWFL